MVSVPVGAEPILLGGYAAKQCPVRTFHDFGPRPMRWEPGPEDQARLDAGIEFEAEVFAALIAANPSAVWVDPGLRRDAAVAATVAAMDAGAAMILGGWLPDDVGGARKGRPDVLVAVGGGYLPADVKHHHTLSVKRTTTAVVSQGDSASVRVSVDGWSSANTHRVSDGLQLAHYTRMLEACGRHPGVGHQWAAVVGTSRVQHTEVPLFVWHDLNAPIGYTFSRRRGKAARTLLERYDHEHGFRVAVAAAARSEAAPGAVSVAPVGQPECRSCPYASVCSDQMGPQNASNALTVGSLDTREWLALRSLGVATLAELAAVDPDAAGFARRYYPEVTHRGADHARRRLADAVERAGMLCAGRYLQRRMPVAGEVPVADVEVDIDIEWGGDGRVYLWGARVRRGQDEASARFEAFADWSVLDDGGERALAQRFADWLRGLRDDAARAGETVRVFHWSPAESSRLRRILGAGAADLLDSGVLVDLERVFDAQFRSVHGNSVKVVAPLFGFAWRAGDAGGALSQTRLEESRVGRPGALGARRWLLDYNSDDTAAMAAVRDGMRG